jgi:GNAT superfamily N-acetyltransferase
LSAAHDFSRFECGEAALDHWLWNHARRSEGRSARTYVACVGQTVVGYYCIAAGSVDLYQLPPGKLRRNAPTSVPVAILGRLAVDRSFHRRGLGADLLMDAFARIVAASETVGMRAVLVHAKDEKAMSFYKHQAEFLEFPEGSQTLYLPIETIIEAL